MEQLDDQLDDIRSMLDFKPSKAEKKQMMIVCWISINWVKPVQVARIRTAK